MDSTDYKIIKGQLATKIGKAVAQFVREVGVDNLTIYVAVDKPMASFFEDGSSNGMTSIRVYFEEGGEDDGI